MAGRVNRPIAEWAYRPARRADLKGFLREAFYLLTVHPDSDGGGFLVGVVEVIGVDEEHTVVAIVSEGELANLEFQPGQARSFAVMRDVAARAGAFRQVGYELLNAHSEFVEMLFFEPKHGAATIAVRKDAKGALARLANRVCVQAA